MKNTQARFREAGSFIAGLLIGLSIVVPVFAMTVADPSDWQKMLWVFGALTVLALGLALQVVVTTKRRYRRTTDPRLEALPIRFAGLSHER